jgi:diguanylate cyclase
MFDYWLSKARARARRLLYVFYYPSDPLAAARLQEEQFAALRRNTPGMMAANICNALVLLATLIDTPLRPRAVAWANTLFFVSLYIYLRARRRAPSRRKSSTPTSVGRRAVVNALVLGALWAAVPILFFPQASAGARFMVISITAGMLFGGAFALARAPLAATLFAGLIAVSSAATLLQGDDPNLPRIAILLCVYVLVLLRNVYVEAESFKDRVLSQMGAEREARTDALTGLPNRLAFNDALEREIARVRRKGGSFLLLCVDVDNFKAINDRFGHPAGDELLTEASRRMRAALRASDFIARLGGDEFAVIGTDVPNEEAAAVLAERIVACFDAPFVLDGTRVQSAVSIGGAIGPRHGVEIRTLFKNADLALYQSKQKGGWRLFEQADASQAAETLLVEQDLRGAMSLGQLVLVYQPIMNVAANSIVGCEAFLRWRHPTQGELAPPSFLQIAERLGLIHEIGLWVVAEACAAAARLPEDFRVAVNVSATQLCRSDFAERVLEAVTRANLSPQRIEVEIGEKAALAEDALSDAEIMKMSRAGLRVSLDDFGSGYSSLGCLCRLPFDRVKIDRPLVRAMLQRKDCNGIVTGVTHIAREFGMGVVAKGVETMAQLQRLREIGCTEAQGYLIAAPMPLDELEVFLAKWEPDWPARQEALKKRA